ncbi:MAG: membrane protein insertase YidC [Candidatus Aminicenantales bacterium]
MEKRLLLAIVLSFLILVLWQLLFVKKPEEKPAAETPAEITKKTEKEAYERALQPPAKKKSEEKAAAPEILRPTSAEEEEKIIVETSLYRAVWTNRGGVLESWKLKKHKDENREELELVSPRAEELKIFPFSLKTDDPLFDDTVNSAYYKTSKPKLSLENGQKAEMRFEYADGKGNSVEKIFTFEDGTYNFTTEIKVIKKGKEINPRLLWGPGFSLLSPVQKKGRFGGTKGLAALIANKVFHMDERKYKPEQSVISYAQWAAYEDTYFAALFLLPPVKNNAEFIREEREDKVDYFLLLASPQRAYLGPKELDVLVKFGYQTKKIIRFGLFGFIAEILLRAIKIIHQGIPNWGVAIIILTLITKIIFFPLTYSSTKSMAKMQEIQPKIKALRSKYKKAKQDIAQRRKMNEEMMKLYKEHGINPAGGCLPMLIQLPVFWGFFQLLRLAIEFRHSHFILWITDLSTKDPYYVTPILMGITQYISQKITPTSADPTQQRMMLIMPVVLTFFFMSFPSGLVLYWLTQNVLQIGQQLIMNRLMKKKRVTHGKRKKRK